MIGFRSPPFLLFFPPLPFAALFAAVTACFALLMAAFLMSLPFIICRWVVAVRIRRLAECVYDRALNWSKAVMMANGQKQSPNVQLHSKLALSLCLICCLGEGRLHSAELVDQGPKCVGTALLIPLAPVLGRVGRVGNVGEGEGEGEERAKNQVDSVCPIATMASKKSHWLCTSVRVYE